jgi:6-phosphogluconolactonase
MRNFLKGNKKGKAAFASILAVSIALVAIFGAALSADSQSYSYGNTGAVYTIDNSASGNNVLLYTRGSDGTLTAAGTFATEGLGTGSALASQGAVVLTPNGEWLLVVDAGSNQISVFSVGHDSLTFASITGSEGSTPISLTVSRNLVYVLNSGGSGNIAGFYLGSDGSLTYITDSTQPLSGNPSPSPEQIGFSPSANVLVVTEKATNIIDTYTVSSSGLASAPTTHASVGQGPYGFAFSKGNELIVSEAASDTITSYAVSDSGSFRTLSGAMPTFGNAPCWLAINSQFVYTTNAHGGTISTFSNDNDGTLALTSSIAASTAIPALDLAFGANGQFLYVHDGNSITGYSIHQGGSLSTITTVNGVPAAASGLAAS